MDPSHRDRIAFARICSGRFERGMTRHLRPHRPRAHHQVRHHGVRRRPRDGRRGLPRRRRRPRQRHRRAARRHALRRRRRSTFPPIPRFSPEVFATARPLDTGRVQAVPQGPRAARRGGRGAGAARPRLGDTRPDPRRRRRSCSSRCSATGWPASSARRPRSSPPPYQAIRRTDKASAPRLRDIGGIRILRRGRRRAGRAVREPLPPRPPRGRRARAHPRTARRRRADAGLMPAASR